MPRANITPQIARTLPTKVCACRATEAPRKAPFHTRAPHVRFALKCGVRMGHAYIEEMGQNLSAGALA